MVIIKIIETLHNQVLKFSIHKYKVKISNQLIEARYDQTNEQAIS